MAKPDHVGRKRPNVRPVMVAVTSSPTFRMRLASDAHRKAVAWLGGLWRPAAEGGGRRLRGNGLAGHTISVSVQSPWVRRQDSEVALIRDGTSLVERWTGRDARMLIRVRRIAAGPHRLRLMW